MSLFKTRNLWSTQCGIDETFDSTSIITAEISENSHQVVVGSHSGHLRVFKPSFERPEDRNNEVDYKPTDLIIETQLSSPILQVAVGRLVSGTQTLYLVILHPRSLAVYSVATKSGAVKHGDQSRLVLQYEHQLVRSAYSMVVGSFGQAQGRDFICVQSLDGTLSFYEQEAFAFNWFFPSFLLPGPLAFISTTDSFVTVSSSWFVESYRYQLMAEAKVLKDQDSDSGKKTLPDWSYNLGEPAIDVQIISVSSESAFIMILGERNFFCLLSNGALRFMKRLEYKPFCFHAYIAEPDGRLMTMISTDSNTLLVYEQTTLRWSSQLEFTPVAVSRGNFHLAGVLVLLSDIGELQLCFLGTAPSLFVPPPIDTHTIDYKASAIELAKLQKIIKSYSKSNSRELTITAPDRDLSVNIVIGPQLEPCAFKTNVDDTHTVDSNRLQAPMSRVAVELLPHTPLNKVQVAIIVQFPLAVNQVSHTITSLCNANQVISYAYHIDASCDVSSLEVRVVTSYLTSTGIPRVVHSLAQLPLALVAGYAQPDREADFKLTINTNQPAISLALLFPEFVSEGALSSTSTSAGFRYLSQTECSVSILSAKSSLRYRLQSNNLPSLCLFTNQIISRLKKHFSKNKDFVCTYSSSLPIHELFSIIDAHFVLREKSRKIYKDLDLLSCQFRAVQRRLLTKFKDKTPRPLANLDMLLKDTHSQIVALAGDFEQNQLALSRSSCQLGCIIQLILMLIKLMNFASEEDYKQLAMALSAPIQDTDVQGWEEVTEAAISHLLRTVFSKSANDQQSSKPITLEPMKDTSRLKKHISTAIDRLSKASYSNKFKDDNAVPVANISSIPEAGEGSEATADEQDQEKEADVPLGSRYGERAVSARTRGKQGPLLPTRKKIPDEGSLAACTNEGEEVSVATIKDLGCFRCTCKNGFVECERPHCPSQQGCYMLLESRKDGCCQLCKGCLHRGVEHASGTEWPDPGDPCRVMTCKAGVVTESNVQCYTPCAAPLPPAPGQCCPTCRGCRINGQAVGDRVVTTPEDPCLKCHCDRGQLTCSKRACPVLECPANRAVRSPGECCATCSGSRSLLEPPLGRCLLGHKMHVEGDRFHFDRCTTCACLNSTSVCVRKACPVLECHYERQVTVPGDCCPHCPPVEESRTACTFAGRTYEDGESWKMDSCKSCSCNQGQARCAMEICPRHSPPCPPHTKLVHWAGECCPRCVEGDGVCTVFGDPHYRTFDGKFYSFQGSCKYQLTADCVGRSFSIRVTNDARSTKTSSWTKTVSIKMGDTKINLGQKLRVKIDGVRVDPPHRSLDGRVWVNKTDDGVLVHTHIGVKVAWDGNSFLEVSAPTAYKGRLCGLCGNYNSASRDDWTTRRGRLVLDPDKFGTSWRVGGKKACARPREELASEMQCYLQKHRRRPRDLRRCKPLRGQVFNPCHKKVNSDKYFDSCIEDMCECPNGKCFCESFTAYAHECQRLGVKMPNWRQATGCPSPWAAAGGGKRPPPPRLN